MAAGKNSRNTHNTPASSVESLKSGFASLRNWTGKQASRLDGVLKQPQKQNNRRAEDKSSPLCCSGSSDKPASARRQSRRFSATVCLLLVMAQMLMMGAAIAQTRIADPSNPQQNNAAELAPDGHETDDTVPNPYINSKGFVPVVNTSADVNVKGGAAYGGSTKGINKNVADMLKRDNPYGSAEQGQQPAVFKNMQGANQQGGGGNSVASLLGQGQRRSQQTLASLAMQSAEQGNPSPQLGLTNILSTNLGSINDTYRGMHQFFNDDIIGNLFGQIGQLIGKWLSELINGWIADTVQFLAAFLRVFVLNPNVAVNGLNGSQNDGISPYIRQGADVMYGIACDLLLLLFILAIWKYWTEAAWRGAGNLMGAVGRLIATAGLMLAFPTLYAFEIQITNEMIKAIYFNSSDQVLMLDSALASAVRGGILAGVGGLASAFAPLLGGLGLGIVGGTVGEIFAFAGLIIFTILGGILITELVYILVLKAIQTALLTAQYMFAPIFLVFFATPDTENVATGFVRAWVETSLWTFVWVGLLKIMVIIMFSNYNPWGKILMAVGVLQMMIQVPTFLARAQISPMSDFISAGLVTGGLFKMFGAMGKMAQTRVGQAVSYLTNDKYAASGVPQTSAPTLDNINRQSGNPDLTKSLRDASKLGREGAVPTGPVPGTGQDLKTAELPKTPTDPNAKAGQNLANAQNAARTGAVPPSKNATDAKNVTGDGTPNPAADAATQGTPVTPATGGNPAVPPTGAKPTAGAATNGTTSPATGTPGLNNGATPASGLGKAATVAGVAAGAGALAAGVGGARGVTTPSAGSPPGTKEDEVFNPERKLGTDYYHNPGMVAVDAVRGTIGQIKTLGIRVQEGTESNSLEGTTRGGAHIVKLRDGATAAEKAHVLMAAGLANKTQSDPAAMDAARQSAIDSGADRPQGLMENLAANWLAYSGGTFKQTATAKGRFQRAMYAEAAQGSQDYIGGKQGNAYTSYLRGRYGAWTADMDASAVWLATDPDASESAWNPAIGPATDALSASGLAITGATRGAIQNPFVMTMRPGARKAAVRALLRACMYDGRMEGKDPNTMDGGILLGEIARSMPESFVQTAIAVDAVSGGRDLAPDNLQTVSQLSSEMRETPDATYRSASNAVGWVAKGVTGNSRMSSARNFDQVRRMISSQYSNPDEAAAKYQEVLVETADRVRSLHSAGVTTRMMTESGFAGDVHSTLDTHIPELGNMKDPVSSGQALTAVATVARLFGSAGFTQNRAHATLRYIQDGNTPGTLTAQDVVIAERLVGGGASGLNQTMIGVTRNMPHLPQSLSGADIAHIMDVSNAVENNHARVDQAMAVTNVMGAGGSVNKQTVEVAARLARQPGGFDAGVFRVQAELLQHEIVGNAGDAHMVMTNCVNSAARVAGINPAGMAIGQVMNEIQKINPNYNMDTVQQTITNISRNGGYESHQMVNPVVFEAAYQAQNFMPTNSHRVASIQIAERIHGAGAVSMPEVLETYDDVLEAGVEPRDMNLQRFYAARALREYKSNAGMSAAQGPQPVYQVLERIRQDSRFQLRGASMQQPPQLDPGLFSDIMNMRKW